MGGRPAYSEHHPGTTLTMGRNRDILPPLALALESTGIKFAESKVSRNTHGIDVRRSGYGVGIGKFRSPRADIWPVGMAREEGALSGL